MWDFKNSLLPFVRCDNYNPRSATMETSSNLLVPQSVGALLAEEWSINPLSVLPSFFEMILIEDASKSGRGALRSVVEVVAQRMSNYGDSVIRTRRGISESNDSVFSRYGAAVHLWIAATARKVAFLLQRFSPELRCLIVYLLERQSLRSSSCTLAESIYGTKRAVVANETPSTIRPTNSRMLLALNQNHATRLALVLAVSPYLREKLDNYYQKFSRGSLQDAVLRRVVLRYYPILMKAFDGANLVCQWRFLLGRSVFFDLASLFLGQVVRRATQQDEKLTSSGKSKVRAAPATSSSQVPDVQVDSRLQKSVLYLLSASVAFSWLTQLRATWQEYRHDRELRRRRDGEASSAAQTTSPIFVSGSHVPPPPPHFVDSGAEQNDSSLCPLCRRKRVEPTASTSGYVFCHSCLVPFVKEYGTCPVTGVDCPESRTLRLYEPRRHEKT